MSKFQVTVTGDLGSFKTGQVLTTGKEIADYHRVVLNEGADEPTSLSDEQIVTVVRTIAGDSEDAEVERVGALQTFEQGLSDTDDTTDDTETDDRSSPTQAQPDEIIQTEAAATGIRAAAIQMAALIATDTALMAELNGDLDAKERITVAPLKTMIRLRNIKGLDLDAAPVPGSKPVKGSNLMADRNKIMVRKTDGSGMVQKTVSFYDLLAASLPEGKRLDNAIAALDKAKADTSKAIRIGDHASDRAALVARRTNLRASIRKGVALHLQFKAVEELTDVICKYRANKDVLISTTYPIVISDKNDHANASAYSIAQFLAMKPETAKNEAVVKEKGSQWAALVTSGGKGADDKSETGEAWTIDTVEENAAMMAHWLENKDNIALLYKRLNAPAAESDAMVVLMVDLALELTTFKEKYWARYNKIVTKDTKAA